MAATFQYGGHAQFFNFLNLNSAILQYGLQGALFKCNLTFYNTAAIFKSQSYFKVLHFYCILTFYNMAASFKFFKNLLFLKKKWLGGRFLDS
jgi:hypothetical protein